MTPLVPGVHQAEGDVVVYRCVDVFTIVSTFSYVRERQRSMLTDTVLRDDWHVVACVSDLREGKPVAVRLLDEDIVLVAGW
jgi:hypothetical protein